MEDLVVEPREFRKTFNNFIKKPNNNIGTFKKSSKIFGRFFSSEFFYVRGSGE